MKAQSPRNDEAPPVIHFPPRQKRPKFAPTSRHSSAPATRPRTGERSCGLATTAAMTALCRLFPTLRDEAPIDPFDPDTLLAWLCGTGACSGAKHAGRFVLEVWHTGTDWIDYLTRLAGRTTPPEDEETRALWRSIATWRRRAAANLQEEKGRAARPEEVEEGLRAYFQSAKPFSTVSAFGCWDEAHRRAFLTWCETPFFP